MTRQAALPAPAVLSATIAEVDRPRVEDGRLLLPPIPAASGADPAWMRPLAQRVAICVRRGLPREDAAAYLRCGLPREEVEQLLDAAGA